MDNDLLREHLAKLHDELKGMREVDLPASQLLVDLQHDIKRLLDRSATSMEETPSRSLPERLEKIAVQFEADHPTLAASSRRLVDLLGKAGL